MKKHDFVECQDPLGCTISRLSLCHRAKYGSRDCGQPREADVHNPSVDRPILEVMDDLDRDLEEDEADLLAGVAETMDAEAVEGTVPSVDDGQPSLPPSGFTRQYLYCQHRWNRTFCPNNASIVLVEDGRPFDQGQRWMVCFDHSNHRPPIATDRRWRAPTKG